MEPIRGSPVVRCSESGLIQNEGLVADECSKPIPAGVCSKHDKSAGCGVVGSIHAIGLSGVDASDAVRSIGGQTLKWWGLPYLNRDELRIHPEAWREVWRKTADVYVLSGMYTSLTFQVCILLLWLRGLPFVLWLERPAEASRNDVGLLMRVVRWPLFQLRNLVFRWMFFAASGVVAIGSLAARQYREKGAPADRVSVYHIARMFLGFSLLCRAQR